jgi:hypothetical protein
MQGRCFCSESCLQRELEGLFEGILVDRQNPRSMHRMPLGLLMLSRGIVSEAQAQTDLSTQRKERRDKIGQWLQRLGFATERQVVTALALQWATPVLALPAESAPQSIIPLPVLTSLRIMPVRFVAARRLLYVAFSNEVDHTVLQATGQMTECQSSACVVSDAAMDRLLQRAQSSDRNSTHLFEKMNDPIEIARTTASYSEKTGATDVDYSKCGPYIWVRLRAVRKYADLLFDVSTATATRTFSASPATHVTPRAG